MGAATIYETVDKRSASTPDEAWAHLNSRLSAELEADDRDPHEWGIHTKPGFEVIPTPDGIVTLHATIEIASRMLIGTDDHDKFGPAWALPYTEQNIGSMVVRVDVPIYTGDESLVLWQRGIPGKRGSAMLATSELVQSLARFDAHYVQPGDYPVDGWLFFGWVNT